MFRDAKVGDRVWSFSKGWGEISKIDADGIYRIKVEFDSCDIFFTVDGLFFESDLNPTLFWDEIKFEIPEKPRWKPKEGEIYYFPCLSLDGRLKYIEVINNFYEYDKIRISNNLAFKTKEEAELFHDKLIELAKNFNQ